MRRVGARLYQKLLALLTEPAGCCGVLPSHIATKYILGLPSVACAIIGVRNSRHVGDNSMIFELELTVEDEAAITPFLNECPRLAGDCYTLERTSQRYRGIIHMNVNGERQGEK